MTQQGKLIVIEGLDGSGKATQSALLTQELERMGRPVREVAFPCYDQPSSALIKLYLQGAFGDSPDSVGPYAASTFFAVDRYASFKRDWGAFYQGGGIVVANRYVTSNLVHQMTKLPQTEWQSFIAWLEDLEYEKFGIPRPDLVLYLDMPVAVSQALMRGRYHGDEQKKDIHEKDVAYLEHCAQAAEYACRAQRWMRVPCSANEQPLAVEQIHTRVLAIVKEGLAL